MSRSKRPCIVGAFEHPTRYAPEKSTAQLHAECAAGALADAGLTWSDVDGYFCSADSPAGIPALMVDYLNLNVRHVDGTESGGCSYVRHVGLAAQAIAAGKCSVALIVLAGKPRSSGQATGTELRKLPPGLPASAWEAPYAWTITGIFANIARRHMHVYGTTPEQMAWVKVSASLHAQHNPNAFLKRVFSIDDVLGSPMVADPLHRLDCCVITDGGGALVLAHPRLARELKRPVIEVAGSGYAVQTNNGGYFDMLRTGAAIAGARAFSEANMGPGDVQYVSLYDAFTIMVIMQLEDLGFCEPGKAGHFVADGNLISGQGRLPFNTDGGGLCNNHPQNRGGMTKVIEAVRQLRGEAHPNVQVKNCARALVNGQGMAFGMGHTSATLLLERCQ